MQRKEKDNRPLRRLVVYSLKAAAQYTAAFYVLILSYNPLFPLAIMIFGKILHHRYIFR